MLKAILWDIDGVIIRHQDYFHTQLEKDNYYKPQEILNEFRTTKLNNACDQGLLDPLISIMPFLERIGWNKSSEEYFDKQYEYEDKYIDDSLIERIQLIRAKNIKCYIASNQNYYRKEHLIHRLNLNTKFDGFIFSYDLNAVKTEDKYWELLKEIMTREDIRIHELLFLDDMETNTKKASEHGILSKIINTEDDINEVFMSLGICG